MNSPKLSSPCMDITVIRNGRNVCGVDVDKSQDSMLLKRRIEIPYMDHIDLDNQKYSGIKVVTVSIILGASIYFFV